MYKALQEKLTVEECREICRYIPRPNHEVWLKIASALVSEIGESNARSVMTEAFPDEKPNETQKLIASLHGAPKCTIGTLIDIAKKHGFDAKAFFSRRRRARWNAPAAAFKVNAQAEQKRAAASKEKKLRISRKVSEDALGVCSMCDSVCEPDSVKETSLLDVLKQIKSGAWKNEVAAVRAGTREKTTLPQCCAFGVYEGRRADENLRSRSGFLVLDYDAKENRKTDFERLRERWSRMKSTFADFASPSGNGLKVIIRISDEYATAREAFEAVAPVVKMFGGKVDDQPAALQTFIVSDDDRAFINPAPLAEIPEMPQEVDVETAAVVFDEFISRCYFAGKDTFFIFEGESCKEITRGDLITDCADFYKIERSEARVIVKATRKTRYVERIFPALTCRKRGMHVLDGFPVLAKSSPVDIERLGVPVERGIPLEKACPFIAQMLSTIFPDEENRTHFLYWLKIAREAFERALDSNCEIVLPVPFLLLLGKAGAGKDLLFQTLINPLLGGRATASMNTFPQERQWLGEIIGSECVLGTEIQNLTKNQRDAFKATCKAILGDSGFRAELKGKDGLHFRGQFFLVQLANLEAGCAAGCPALDDADFTDKFFALDLQNSDAVKKMFPSDKKTENAAAIREELPLLAQWLKYDLQIPEFARDERFGVKAWQSTVAREALFEVSPLENLHLELAEIARLNGRAWQSEWHTTGEIAKEITRHFSRNVSPNRIGRDLKSLASKFPKFYRWNENSTHSAFWIKEAQ